MRKVFLDDLPRFRFWKGQLGGVIDWKNSKGCKVKGVYEDINFEVEILDYDGKYLYIKYLDKEPFKVSPSSFSKCRLGKLLGKITDEFKIEIGTTFKDEKRDLTIIDRDYIKDKQGRNWKYYKYRCNKCGFDGGEHYKSGKYIEELWIAEGNLLTNGNGCPCCCSNSQITVPHINSIVAKEETMWMVKYFQGGYEEAKRYTPKSTQSIKPVCPDCGRIKTKKITISTICQAKSIGCTCGDGFSYGHKYIFNMLTQLNLGFVENKRFDWCKFPKYKNNLKTSKGEYDFVIEEMKFIIEADGGFHREDNLMSGQTKEESVYIDDTKDKLAKQNGYKVVRISDEDSIRDNILKSELVNILNLNNIDWNKCEEFALSNRVMEACEIKRDNPDMSVKEIGRTMNVCGCTIRKYLKKGSEIWDWINYDPKEEKFKGNSKAGKTHSKRIEIFKDGISLGVFESEKELSERSEELFGVRLDRGNISAVIVGKQTHHKGYQFKYI